MEYSEDKINDGWRTVHNKLGMTIYWDIQSLKKRFENKEPLKIKMESMTDSLINRLIKNPKIDYFSEDFMSYYNTDPTFYKKLITDEYIREYENKFHLLYDFHNELETHKNNIEVILGRIKTKKDKTEEDYKYVEFLKDYILTIKEKFSDKIHNLV
jgi:hypothetical protein